MRQISAFIPASWRGRRAVDLMEASGVPVIDELLHDTYGPDRVAKEVVFRKMLDGVQPGFTHFLIHPAHDTPELRGRIDGWETRVADYEIFAEGSLHGRLADAGVQFTGYRTLRDAIRAGTLLPA